MTEKMSGEPRTAYVVIRGLTLEEAAEAAADLRREARFGMASFEMGKAEAAAINPEVLARALHEEADSGLYISERHDRRLCGHELQAATVAYILDRIAKEGTPT